MNSTSLLRSLRAVLLTWLAHGMVHGQAPSFKPGEIVIVSMYGKPEEAQVVKVLPDGVQVRQKDWQDGTYKADGPTRHYSLAEVKRKEAAADNPADSATPTPGKPTEARPAQAIVDQGENGPPMTKEEIIDILKARIGTDGPHPQKEAVNLELRELIKKRGVSFRYSTLSDRHLFTQVGGIGSMIDAVEANYGKPKPKSWLWGEWNISTTSTRTFSLSNAVNQMGFLVIEPDGKYLWKVKADDETKNWIDGKWREPTADEMKWMGGAGVVLIGGEQGYDWIVYRDYTADDGKDWITIAVINSRQTFRSGLRVP